MNLQEEINQNMTVTAAAGFALNNEELETIKNNQVWANSRANRRMGVVDKPTHRRNPQGFANNSKLNNPGLHASNLMQPSPAPNIVVQQMPVDVNQEAPRNDQNNKNNSEDIETLRENIRNSNESLRKSSSENILEIEESMRKNTQKMCNKSPDNNSSSVHNARDNNHTNNTVSQNNTTNNNMSSGQTSVESNNIAPQNPVDNTNTSKTQMRNNPSTLRLNYAKCNQAAPSSSDVLNESSADLYSPTSPTAKDPHSAYIDLSNNCRQFYFSHLKTAEAIKQTVRSARHNKALDKVQGKHSSGIDNAMDRLRAEMAELMDQDLSLMSQLLTLNDKIEEIKHHVRNSAVESSSSQSLSYMSTGDFTDNEYSDLEESGIFNRDFSMRRESIALNASMTRVTKLPPSRASLEQEPLDLTDGVKLRKIEPSEREIIVYRKKRSKRRSQSTSRSRNNSSAEDSDATDEESDETSDSNDDSESDTESTISCNSSDNNNSASELTETETKDATSESGVHTSTPRKPEPEVTKPVKGGISRNRFFLKFHKKNGISKAISGANSVLTLQGHHIPLEKYYIPQGLVYLKHTESDNVFCQFSH